MLRTCIIDAPPTLPPKPEGYQPRYCESAYRLGRPCNTCQKLNEILTDPARQTGEFCELQMVRRHIEQMLQYDNMFLLSTDPKGGGGRRCRSLIVTKKVQGAEHARAMDEYLKEVRGLERKTEDFHGERFRKILGEELYGELVLLRRLPGSQAADPTAAVAGVKREADDDSVLPPAARRYPGHVRA